MLRIASLLPALTLLACQGVVGGPSSPDDRRAPTPAADEGTPAAPVLRRLNHREYVHTANDLFGTELPELSLPHDQASVLSFDTDGESLSLAPGDYERYFEAARNAATALSTPELPLSMCAGLVSAELETCVRSNLPEFLTRALRRPPPVALVAQFGDIASGFDNYDEAARSVVISTLISPYFLFHHKTTAEVRAAGEQDGFEIAGRLSYFLWSSAPDDELLQLAESGELNNASVVAEQARRMFADPRSERFLREFLGQWLKIDELEGPANPVREALFTDMREETVLLAIHLLRSDAPIVQLMDTDQSMLNPALAEHYGVELTPGDGDGFRLVTMPPERRGLLTQGSLIVARSPEDEAQPFKRGSWVAGRLTCLEPPPPPDDIPTPDPTEAAQTIREVLEQHRANPQCAACHALFDYYGLALEEFDSLGRYREQYPNELSIDPSGELPDGTSFGSTAELGEIMAERDEFEDCFTKLVSGYGLGRALNRSALARLREQIDAYTEGRPPSLTDLIVVLVTSNEFMGDAR